jgi:hypothetical protein
MAFFQDINVWAVLVAAIAFYALGALWYSPVMFARPWMDLLGRKREEMRPAAQGFIVNAIGTLVAAAALAVIVVGGGWTTAVYGLGIGALVGVGFVMTVLLNSVAFEGRPVQLFFINAAYQVIGYCLMGAILGAWHA